MKIKFTLLSTFLFLLSIVASADDWVLNNGTMSAASYPNGKVDISFDFFVTGTPGGNGYTFTTSGNKSGTIKFSFTKLDASVITPAPSGDGSALFDWTLSTSGTGVGQTYTWTGTTKAVTMLEYQSPSGMSSKYKITFLQVPVTYPATAQENNIGVHGIFTTPTQATDPVPTNTDYTVSTNTAAMPVTFQSYDAKLVGNKLVVNWTTASETNNDFFDIQVMGADSSYKTVGRVASKAENGNSEKAIEYSFEKDLGAGGAAYMGIAIFAAGFILLLFNRKNKLLYTFLIVCGMSVSAISCRKNAEDKENRQPDRQMVRVVQVDKEGLKAYSKIAVAIRQ
ncbi:hypothetical protein [Niabella drilacis]|uniref:Uncharacterized protein n=1 Tax=Niabella drilacis (strain DSM 25811 / CCM 8410 / CCUG 62505 / LMG 26954 / E90) TaxID=1285928 RepID=A0A1G7A0B9_NIADE|nr:hypothetical protein [Niabella drilacis]SDE08259.1 hypothetical protein SAMN04487894_12035 [Niabella drilacis]